MRKNDLTDTHFIIKINFYERFQTYLQTDNFRYIHMYFLPTYSRKYRKKNKLKCINYPLYVIYSLFWNLISSDKLRQL